MGKYNILGTKYNLINTPGSITYNSREYIYIKMLNDSLLLMDTPIFIMAAIVLSDKSLSVNDMLFHSAFINFPDEDKIIADDDTSVSLLFTIADTVGIKDELSEFSVLAFLEEKFNLIEALRLFAETIINESIDVNDITSVEALLDLLDKFGFEELKNQLETFLTIHDLFGMTDHEPRQAISDFLIGALENLDRAYDWLIPFNLRVDWGKTNIQVMPEAEITSIDMPGMDGSIVENTTYKDRLFEIVAFSEDGMTKAEKEDLKARIAQILDATKHQTKRLTVQSRGTAFDVKYQGQAKIEEGPSYIRTTIPLHTPPYGVNMFPNELNGSGLINNMDGDAPVGPKFTITGEVTNPSFKLGEYNYSWNGTVPDGSRLVMDFEAYTVYIVDNMGKKLNGLAKFSGEFQKVPAGKSLVLVADENTEPHILTEWETPVLW